MDLQLSSTHSIFKVRIYVAKRIYICIQFYVVDIVTFIFYYNIKRQQNCVVVCVHIKPKNHFHNNNPWLNSGEAITKLIRLLIVLFVFSCSSSTFLFLIFFSFWLLYCCFRSPHQQTLRKNPPTIVFKEQVHLVFILVVDICTYKYTYIHIYKQPSNESEYKIANNSSVQLSLSSFIPHLYNRTHILKHTHFHSILQETLIYPANIFLQTTFLSMTLWRSLTKFLMA